MPTDAETTDANEAYLLKHGIKDLMGSMIQAVVEQKPLDPVQFLVDRLTLENSEAMSCQGPNGLSLWRRREAAGGVPPDGRRQERQGGLP